MAAYSEDTTKRRSRGSSAKVDTVPHGQMLDVKQRRAKVVKTRITISQELKYTLSFVHRMLPNVNLPLNVVIVIGNGSASYPDGCGVDS